MGKVFVRGLALGIVLAATPVQAQSTLRPGAQHAVPIRGQLIRVYDAPDDPYAAGHRGADVAAASGTPVKASADGTVSFAGSVAGNRSVTLDHGNGLQTTYSYLATSIVITGQKLKLGAQVGTVGAGHPNSGLGPHVHLSARRSGTYFDPLELYVGDSYSDLLSIVG